METTATSNVQRVLNFFKALDAQDINKAKTNWADDHQMHFPSGAPGLNKDVHENFTRMFLNAFPDITHEIVDVIDAGKKVITRGWFSGTHKGVFNGIPATGKKIRASWIDIVEFNSEGKVVNEWIELDVLGMMQQLGVVPPYNN